MVSGRACRATTRLDRNSQPAVLLPDRSTSTGGNHPLLARTRLCNCLPLDGAKVCLAILGKDALDGLTGQRDNEIVGVHRLPAQLPRQQRADPRLAGAAKTDEHDPAHFSRARGILIHGTALPGLPALGHRLPSMRQHQLDRRRLPGP